MLEIDRVNVMITDHLRHYGLRIAARVVETEIKKHAFNAEKQPSALLLKVRDPTGFKPHYREIPNNTTSPIQKIVSNVPSPTSRNVSKVPSQVATRQISRETIRSKSPLAAKSVARQYLPQPAIDSPPPPPRTSADPSFTFNELTKTFTLKQEAQSWLQINTDFTARDILELKETYIQTWPSLQMSKENILSFLRLSFGITSPLFADRFFESIWINGQLYVHFRELVTALNYLRNDDPIEFLHYIFIILSIPNTEMASTKAIERFLHSISGGPILQKASEAERLIVIAQQHAPIREGNTVTWPEILEFNKKHSEAVTAQPIEPMTLSTFITELKDYNIEFHLQNWKQIDFGTHYAQSLTAPVGEGKFSAFMKDFLGIDGLDESLTSLFLHYRNEAELIDIGDFLIVMAILVPGSAQNKIQFVFLVWNDLIAAPIVSKAKMIDYFSAAGFQEAQAVIEQLNTEDPNRVQYQELSDLNNYEPTSKLLDLLSNS